MQGHLRKEENCTHHKDGRILHDYAHYLGTSPEQIPVSLRSENGQQPHACAAAQCDGRNYFYGLFYAVGIARAVIIADERLHARAQPVERHTNHLVCTEHYGERGGVIGIAARICL